VADPAAIVWAAALVEERDPDDVLAGADEARLTQITAEVDAFDDPVEAAALLLVRLVQDRPFAGSASAIAWLAAVDLLRMEGLPVRATAKEVRALCRSLRSGRAAPPAAAAQLRRWTTPPGLPCPACGQRVYADDARTRALVARHATAYELTGRCAYEHRSHDRLGRTRAPVAAGLW
jgi:prophage maintenance system killer protein